MTVLLFTRWLFSICNKWSRNSREICTVNKIACYLLHGIVLYIFFLLYFFLLACIFGKVSKGGVGSNKEENMTQSGTVQYVQGLGKNRPLSINYLCTKQNWKILRVLALVYLWSSDCKLYDIKIAQIIEVQLYLLKALTVEFRRQCQRKFDAAMLNVATNKNSRVFFQSSHALSSISSERHFLWTRTNRCRFGVFWKRFGMALQNLSPWVIYKPDSKIILFQQKLQRLLRAHSGGDFLPLPLFSHPLKKLWQSCNENPTRVGAFSTGSFLMVQMSF